MFKHAVAAVKTTAFTNAHLPVMLLVTAHGRLQRSWPTSRLCGAPAALQTMRRLAAPPLWLRRLLWMLVPLLLLVLGSVLMSPCCV